MCDDDFEPNLGKINSQGGKHGGKYLHRVLRATVLAGSRSLGGLSSRRGTFEGSRIGRSAGIGRVLASRDRYAAYRSRRAIVKSRIVKLAGNRAKAALAHLRYIQRDGDTRDGEPGLNYLCSGLMKFWQHIEPDMKDILPRVEASGIGNR